ncbi:MAG TPA: hypothetical protein PKY71_04300 [Smithellaceae bacterium]|nr:hypothetical protein [Smithellaceae bacterium]
MKENNRNFLPDRDSKRTNSKVVSECLPYFYKWQNKTKTLFRGPKPDNFPKNKIISKKEQRHIDHLESYQNPLEKAMEFERIMKAENLTQSGLAEKLDISRVRVSQYLSLLKLPQEKIEYILKNGKTKFITERALREYNQNNKEETLPPQ